METDKNYIEKNGRIYFEVTTLGITIEEWRVRFNNNGYKISNCASSLLFANSKSNYNEEHRYEAGKILKVVLLKGEEIKKDSKRTIKNLKAIALKDLGKNSVSNLKGELVFLIKEKFFNKELKYMDLWCITIPHNPIPYFQNDLYLLNSFRLGPNLFLGAAYSYSDYTSYDIDNVFAFLQD